MINNPLVWIVIGLIVIMGVLSVIDTPYEHPTTTTIYTTVPVTTSSSMGYEVHEWGVLVGCIESNEAFLTSRPKQTLLVKLPVMYVHSNGMEEFDLEVTFNTGGPTDTYPEASVNKNKIKWENVKIAKIAPTVGGVKGFVPLEDIIPKLRDVDADYLTVGDVSDKFLFYEGELTYENKIKVNYDLENMKVTFVNNGGYTVYDVMFVYSRGEDFMHPKIYMGEVEELTPNQAIVVDLNEFTPDAKILENNLIDLGFTKKEANSFANLWYSTMFMPSNYEEYANLIYRLSEDEYDDMISVEFDPEPQKIIRTLYVLFDILEE